MLKDIKYYKIFILFSVLFLAVLYPLPVQAGYTEDLSQAIAAGTITSTPTSTVYNLASLAAVQVPDSQRTACTSHNPYNFLRVPTQLTKIVDTYFIVDCYHNQVIYSDSLDKPLKEWRILTKDVNQPHTIASDGTVYLVDDTENNRVLIFERINGRFMHTQTVPQTGNRPHYIVYDAPSASFYVWSSTTGQMYILKRNPTSNTVYLTQIKHIPELTGIYVRSFTIVDDHILFPSGDNCSILTVDKNSFEVLNRYSVSPAYSGMIQISPIQGSYYITVSTDKEGNQTGATLLRVSDLEQLASGQAEDIYHLFKTEGTPYYLSQIGSTFYLTNHRSSKGIWSFQINDQTLYSIRTIY